MEPSCGNPPPLLITFILNVGFPEGVPKLFGRKTAPSWLATIIGSDLNAPVGGA